MPVGPRLDYPGAFHHVMTRGAEGKPVFSEDTMKRMFKSRLGALCGRFGICVHAWCIMPNHFHLLVESSQGQLQGFMHTLLSSLGSFYNRTNSTRGYVFMGRYRSILVERESYYLELVRYIHLNPVRAGICHTLEELELLDITGHPGILYPECKPSWQHVDQALYLLDPRKEPGTSGYLEFLRDGLRCSARPEYSAGNHILNSRGLKKTNQGISSASKHAGFRSGILGSDEFASRTASILSAERFRCRRRRHGEHAAMMATQEYVERVLGMAPGASRRQGRTPKPLLARRVLAEVLIAGGISKADVARFLGVSPGALPRILSAAQIADSELRSKCLQQFVNLVGSDP